MELNANQRKYKRISYYEMKKIECQKLSGAILCALFQIFQVHISSKVHTTEYHRVDGLRVVCPQRATKCTQKSAQNQFHQENKHTHKKLFYSQMRNTICNETTQNIVHSFPMSYFIRCFATSMLCL